MRSKDDIMVPLLADSDRKISRFFTESEVMHSNTALSRGIDNAVYDSEVRNNAIVLANMVLDHVRANFGPIVPNSWYRSEPLERIVAGAGYQGWCRRHGKSVNESSWQEYFARKQHPKGAAADIEIAGVHNTDLYNWIKDNLDFDQLILEFHNSNDPRSGWVHVSFNPQGNRRQAFSIG